MTPNPRNTITFPSNANDGTQISLEATPGNGIKLNGKQVKTTEEAIEVAHYLVKALILSAGGRPE